MTPSARIAAAIECLDRILEGAAVERVLTQWARGSRFAGSKDRAAVRDHVYGGLRNRDSFAHLGGSLTGRGVMIGWCRSEGLALDELFTGVGHGPAPLSDVETKALGGDDLPRDIPGWIFDQWGAELGADEAERIAALYRDRAPVGIRLRQSDAAELLAQDGIEISTQGQGSALVTVGARKLHQSQAYQTGAIEIQDLGAQALCRDLPLSEGDKVLDYCAGGGGKILALADRAKINAFAHDADYKRMNDLPERAKRAGKKVKLLRPEYLKAHAPYDVVLCDVPCSGSGTWRRNPQSKWQCVAQDVQDICAVQQEILKRASGLVAQDGTLAYATCSLFDAENNIQIQQFCTDNPEWQLQSSHLMTPNCETDGFYWAILQRI